MSDAFILRRGGGMSTNNAVIHVNAPPGSTISFSKGGVVAKELGPEKGFENADGLFADWYFPVIAPNYGEWTVTATKETQTESKSVTVADNLQYDLMINFQKDIFTSTTGQWSSEAGGWTRNSSNQTTINATTKEITSANNSNSGPYWRTNNKIDMTGYSALNILSKLARADTWLWFGASSSSDCSGQGDWWSSSRFSASIHVKSTPVDSAYVTRTVDISNLTGSYYVKWYYNGASYTKRVWLER